MRKNTTACALLLSGTFAKEKKIKRKGGMKAFPPRDGSALCGRAGEPSLFCFLAKNEVLVLRILFLLWGLKGDCIENCIEIG